ncbi:hypothetical protein C0995_000178 [Termitomyces sp. Mi166|nr:hypothetical protein C0995_000178 [Termitomyces sp. Mi166\
MSATVQSAAPAWQTQELQDEWIDLDEENGDDEDDNLTYGTRSISLTAPLATHIYTNSDGEGGASSLQPPSLTMGGTFLIREDVPSEPLLVKTPGRQKKGIINDFFSPLPLERMFEPPSPPQQKSKETHMPLSNTSQPSYLMPNDGKPQDEIVETDMPDMNSFHGRKASIACKFTFAVPRESLLTPKPANSGAFPQAQSTPYPSFPPTKTAPTTDPRLRLFQFQYDTYTREHLSAMVDSIALNSGTGTTPSPTSFNHLSRVSEIDGSVETMSRLRSAKRVKLSPRSDYGEGAGEGASIARPKIPGKDYVGESKSLMQQIKQARDFSTISTVASTRLASPSIKADDPNLNEPGSAGIISPSTVFVRVYEYSPESRRSFMGVSVDNIEPPSGESLTAANYRQQAAALMAQIKNDMKGQKRLFSGDTETSYATFYDDDKFKSSADVVFHIPQDDKENRREPNHSRVSSMRSTKPHLSKHKSSPRKSRRLQADADSLVENVSRLSIHDRRSFSGGSLHSSHPSSTQRTSSSRTVSLSSRPPSTLSTAPSSLAPPAYPSSSLRNTDDLNRFVSSSTTSGMTLTSNSVPSFVKHAGPPHIRTIAPTDMPPVPEVYNGMLFDKVMMKWVKNTARTTQEHSGRAPSEAPSEDPFGDIESLKDDSREREVGNDVSDRQPHPAEMSRIEEQSEVDDEEAVLNSFSTDDPSAYIDVMTGVDNFEDDATTDSEDDSEEPGVNNDFPDFNYYEIQESMSMSSPPMEAHLVLPPTGTPLRTSVLPMTNTPAIRSAMKTNIATPSSALKSKNQTPLQRAHRRSVSFSDGRREGPIQGLGESTTTDGEGDESNDVLVTSHVGSTSGIVHSARSKRIAQMMEALEHDDDDEEDSPTKTGGGPRGETQALTPLRHGEAGSVRPRSHTYRHSTVVESRMVNANATFLTECSFAVSHDRLVEVITDVEPFTPHWDKLNSIDLSGKRLESVARLKEFLPRLDSLNLNSNQLSWLSGIPGSVRTLSAASNSLTGLTSYSHLLNLEKLDISRNDVESLKLKVLWPMAFAELAGLRHLRELKADGNKISSIEGLERMDGLVKLSLQGNSIQMVDLNQNHWTRLESLNLSQNRLERILGLASLQALVSLNIDNNEVGELELDGSMPRLRILRASGNRLRQLRVGLMANLRTLYADNNSLTSLDKVERLTKLENLSVRNQSGQGLNLLTRDVRDVKRLYLSGNPLKDGFLNEACYNLQYLEVAACRLTALPEDMGRLVPNLRALNLNYNFLEDVGALEGLTRLKKLSVIGSRLKSTKPLIRLVQQMPEVEMVDFRYADAIDREKKTLFNETG